MQISMKSCEKERSHFLPTTSTILDGIVLLCFDERSKAGIGVGTSFAKDRISSVNPAHAPLRLTFDIFSINGVILVINVVFFVDGGT